MRKQRFWVLVTATMMWLTLASPATADEIEFPIFEVFADGENGVAAFWNIARDDFCDWLEGGEVGEPPVYELVTATIFFQESGVILGHYDAVRPLELWEVDGDVPPFIDPCVDTDDQAGPLATGYARGEATDDDIPAETRRTNTWGFRGEGTVVDGDGADWSYSWFLRFQVKRGEFSVLAEEFELTPI